MWWLNCFLLGVTSGLAGAAIWAAIVYHTGRHIGWFAFVVGCLVGLSVRLGSVGAAGTSHGTLAVAIAIPCILFGKYAAAHWMAARLDLGATANENFMTALLADRIVAQRQAEGRGEGIPARNGGITARREDKPPKARFREQFRPA